ncbi:Mut7-C RNAse domain-containing protein [Desulfovibrio oxyclinae]|uniref:Mut7-C RNAse domain-containing protein n=1 Tax=Desulfovibrio oxyclinae TaxID=63560 RepID=UPI00058E8B6A|nr:Mut7-C RNAse domain-containing protein [Desulfovibrio oxyclinae]
MTPPNAVVLVFDAGLLGLLTRKADDGEIRYRARKGQSIKDMVESLGVPHTEVGELVGPGGERVGFGYRPEEGGRVEVRSVVEPFDVMQDQPLRAALPHLAFIVDENVAGLAPLLRAMGLDAARDGLNGDATLAERAAAEKRVVLSRDRGLLKRAAVTHGRLLRTEGTDAQFAEIVRHFGLVPTAEFMRRCLRCNRPTIPVEKVDILHLLEPKTKKYFNHFRMCGGCGNIYWRGSHYQRLVNRLARAGVRIPTQEPLTADEA